jgi:purine-nucleoside phosphorylase
MRYQLHELVQASAAFLRPRLGGRQPRVGVVLGSALGSFAARVEDATRVLYRDVPHFTAPMVAGHLGELVLGAVEGTQVAVLAGRIHYYEGHTLDEVTFPVRVLAALGVETLVLTNASGGVNPEFNAGDLMVIDDHLNLMGANPLRGPNDKRLGPRFPDLTDLYEPELRTVLDRAAAAAGFELRHGVYAAVAGPSYETPAEVRALRALGADAVGMSTVPEAVVARHSGLRVAGVSCITNAAAGLAGGSLSHRNVMFVASQAADRLEALLAGFCRDLSHGDRPGIG